MGDVVNPFEPSVLGQNPCLVVKVDSQRISDELDIRRLLTRYARAVDGRDWELYRSLFTDDARVDYSAAGVTAGTCQDAIDFLSQSQRGLAMSMHYVTNVEADINGDTARVSASWCAAARSSDSTDNRFFGGGWHHDLVRVADGWRSRNLRLEIVWS